MPPRQPSGRRDVLAPRRAQLGRAAVLALLTLAPPSLAAQSPWLHAEAGLERDNQVRTAAHGKAQFGRYLGPHATVALDVGGHRIAADGPGGFQPETSAATAGLHATLVAPGASLGVEGAGALLMGAPGRRADWVGHAALRRDLGQGVALRVRGARERYTSTLASLDTLLLSHSVEVVLDRSGAPGWAWEGGLRRTGFGDANPVTTAYAWFLAPLSRSATHALRAGYALGWQDAEHSTWQASGVAPTGSFPQQVPGRYAPYYSPHDVATHSLVLHGALAVGSAWLLADGSAGLRATEIAPLLVRDAPTAAPLLTFHERSFTPYRANLSLAAPTGEATWVTVAVGYERTTYYRRGTLRLAVARAL